MKRRKTAIQYQTLIIGAILLFIVGGCVYYQYYFQPRRIVSDENCSVISISTYDFYEDSQIVYPKDSFNENEVVEILNNYFERRTLYRDYGFLWEEVNLRIVIYDYNRGLRDIRLGEQSYSSGGQGTNKYEILRSRELFRELSNELGIEK